MITTRWRLGIVAALLVLAGGVFWAQAGVGKDSVPENLRDVVAKAPMQLAPMQLTDNHGRAITEAWFAGRWSFVAFGFTHCADVCFATMAQFSAIKRALAQGYPAIAEPQYGFVSVDPERDTPARLTAFLAAFDSRFVGMTGTARQIEALEASMETFHRKQSPSASGDYQLSHSGEIFLIDPRGRVYARFIPPLSPEGVAAQLTSIMSFYARQSGQGPASIG